MLIRYGQCVDKTNHHSIILEPDQKLWKNPTSKSVNPDTERCFVCMYVCVCVRVWGQTCVYRLVCLYSIRGHGVSVVLQRL